MKPFYIKYNVNMSDQDLAHLPAAMLPTYNAGGGYAISQGESSADESVNEAEKSQVKIVTAVTTTYSNITNGKQYEVIKEDVCFGKYTVVSDDGFEVTLPNFQFSAW